MNQDPVENQAELSEMKHGEKKTSYAEMERREQEFAVLSEVSQTVTQYLDLEDILEFTLDTMVNKLGMETTIIYLLDESVGQYTLQGFRGISQAQIDEIEKRRRAGQDITKEVIETGEELFIPNMGKDERFVDIWDNLEGRSYLKMPLMSRGLVVGVLGVVTPPGIFLDRSAVEFQKAVGREIGVAIDNATLLMKMRQREEQAVTLYKLGVKISSSLNLGSVLEAVVEAAQELTKSDIGIVALSDQERMEVIVQAASGNRTDVFNDKRIDLSEGSPWRPLLDGQSVMLCFDDLDCLHFQENEIIKKECIASILAVPLFRGENFLGILKVISRQAKFFLPGDEQLMRRLANQVVASIENAQLYKQLHYLAATEERSRLARELHDHLAQGLGYLKIKSSITDELLSAGKIEKAHASLLELKKAIQILYTNVREEIFNLRTSTSEQMIFISTLQDYLTDYQTHYGLKTRMIIEKECNLEFSVEGNVQLLRIIQEALSNVRRHSNVNEVLIRCEQDADSVQISIEDSGRGFNPGQVTRLGGQHYGLSIMKERALSVGGNIILDSKPGKGTRVIVRIPVYSME